MALRFGPNTREAILETFAIGTQIHEQVPFQAAETHLNNAV